MRRGFIHILARELGGEVRGERWLAVPAPGYPSTDRSIRVALIDSAPDGFAVITRTIDRDQARAHVRAAIERVKGHNRRAPDLFGEM